MGPLRRLGRLIPVSPMSTETMALTLENVEKVLDELRPFLMADGGNVEVVELDGPIVKVGCREPAAAAPTAP